MSEIDSARLHRFLLGLGAEGHEALSSSTISIVSDSVIGKYFALPIAAAGIPVKLIDKTTALEEKLIDIPVKDGNRARGYISALKEFSNSPALESLVGIEAELGYYGSPLVLKNSKVVIDCTNNPRSKTASLDFSTKNNAAFISVSVIPGYGRLDMVPPKGQAKISVLGKGMAELEESLINEEGALLTKEMIGAFMGGIAAEEATRFILGKEPLNRRLCLNLGYDDVFMRRQEHQSLNILKPNEFSEKSALLFGVGAVGANTGYWLSRLGLKRVDALDYDTVDITNVIRTLFYHHSVGQLKADVAAQKFQELSGNRTSSTAIKEKLQPDWKPGQRYDVFVDGFDNFSSRNLVHQLAISEGTPLLSASGRFDGFDMEFYLPGKTLCFDCNFGLSSLAEKEDSDRRNSCTVEFTPQNSWINQSLGSLAAMMIAGQLAGKKVPNGMIFYEPAQDNRLFINAKQGYCGLENGVMVHGHL
jgi:molybdopterin/thiamine biosynthesis adenylyltransferase